MILIFHFVNNYTNFMSFIFGQPLVFPDTKASLVKLLSLYINHIISAFKTSKEKLSTLVEIYAYVKLLRKYNEINKNAPRRNCNQINLYMCYVNLI